MGLVFYTGSLVFRKIEIIRSFVFADLVFGFILLGLGFVLLKIFSFYVG